MSTCSLLLAPMSTERGQGGNQQRNGETLRVWSIWLILYKRTLKFRWWAVCLLEFFLENTFKGKRRCFVILRTKCSHQYWGCSLIVLRAKNCRGIYCLLCWIGARNPTTCLLVSFAALGRDVHGPLRISARITNFWKGLPGKVTCREVTGAIQSVSLIANFRKSFEKDSKW